MWQDIANVSDLEYSLTKSPKGLTDGSCLRTSGRNFESSYNLFYILVKLDDRINFSWLTFDWEEKPQNSTVSAKHTPYAELSKEVKNHSTSLGLYRQLRVETGSETTFDQKDIFGENCVMQLLPSLRWWKENPYVSPSRSYREASYETRSPAQTEPT